VPGCNLPDVTEKMKASEGLSSICTGAVKPESSGPSPLQKGKIESSDKIV